ncbi:Hypothetical protein NTJ_01995 [Nesidiocoris tenuis]|uniref:Uncharacterized protein n=1 Tax=Nesidiocoris tenuis TaxID=355587 RepID=A0ABN7AA60_9HEMI|nr:Hypothetical protein NTJ_01995 [Nesidiocoris tenuis]
MFANTKSTRFHRTSLELRIPLMVRPNTDKCRNRRDHSRTARFGSPLPFPPPEHDEFLFANDARLVEMGLFWT